ncbi:hypothetical protein IFM89_026760 [Coptis chinensis]|uniref:Uncharacterized protein n=1 Tax=Coptis chinensis TaxID=261450 RepID=A0A835I044_9MAGN|nr:hypothetical protein IFM89_026760 [Coptis chinensis]
MQDAEAVPALEKVLQDLFLHPIVRHEAAEALGAIGLEGNIPLLEKTLVSDPYSGGERNIERHVSAIYAALFALQNRCEDVARLQNKDATAALSRVLKNVSEHPVVRHEAAEALGSIADSQSVELLEEFAKDAEPIVSQSCEVALSMLEFERSGKSFEYLLM